MTPCRKLRERGSPALITALIFSISICASSSSFAADEQVSSEAPADFVPGSERGSMRPPATFFSINAVLAKLDRQSGRGPDAIRHAVCTAADHDPVENDVAGGVLSGEVLSGEVPSTSSRFCP